jgi:hypothetical protein
MNWSLAQAQYVDGVAPDAPAAPNKVGQAGRGLWSEWGHIYPKNGVAYSNYIERRWKIKWNCCDGLPMTSEVSYE